MLDEKACSFDGLYSIQWGITIAIGDVHISAWAKYLQDGDHFIHERTNRGI
jgi:hypothetical protein